MRTPSMALAGNQRRMAAVLQGLGLGDGDVRSPTRTATEVRSPTSTSTEVRSPTSTSTEVRSPTSTSTEVRSPTSTSTDAYTRGNITVTGGAGEGAYTVVEIHQGPQRDYPERAGRAAGRSQEAFGRQYGRAATAPRPEGMPAALRFNADAPRPGGTPAALRFNADAPRPGGTPAALRGFGAAPSTADRNAAVLLFQRQQNRFAAAMDSLFANAPEARAANPRLYQDLILVTNQLVGRTNAFFERVIVQAPEDATVQAALADYTAQVEAYVGHVQRLTKTFVSNNPAPPVSNEMGVRTAGLRDAPPTPPITPLPDGAILTTTAKPRTWVFYAFAGSGVLAVLSLFGLAFLRQRLHKRNAVIRRFNRKHAR